LKEDLNSKWTVVYDARDSIEAELIKGLLESNGIKCILKVSWSAITCTEQSVSVIVEEKDLKEALHIIQLGDAKL
jgi:hypothetical protein